MANVRTDFIITPEGRFNYCFLDIQRTEDQKGQKLAKPKYEARFMIPKTAPTREACRVYQMLAAKVFEVVQSQFRGQWPNVNRQTGVWENWPISDGDAGTDPPIQERGCWSIRLSGGKFPPRVFDQNNNDIPKDVTGRFRGFKDGDYGIASINVFGYENVNGDGVSFGVEGIKKTRDGEPLGGNRRSAQEMFGGPAPQSAPPPLPPQAMGPPQVGGQYSAPPPQAPPPPAPPAYQPQQPPAPVSPYPGYRFDPASGGWVPDNQPPFPGAGAPIGPPAIVAAPVPVGMSPLPGGNATYHSSAPPGPSGMPPPPPMPPFGMR